LGAKDWQARVRVVLVAVVALFDPVLGIAVTAKREVAVGALVLGVGVTVVALFTGIDFPVSAVGLLARATTVEGIPVTVVALLARLDYSVAAFGHVAVAVAVAITIAVSNPGIRGPALRAERGALV
jgi:hypothetical protein